VTAPPLPPLREVIARHGLAARKGLGQHFLLDLNLTAKIARLAGPLADAPVVEVGPGPGGLTRALLDAGSGPVIAIERDPRCLPILAELAAAYPGRVHAVEADALTAREPDLLAAAGADAPAKVVANLPYNIATPLVLKWLSAEPRWWLDLTLMFQKEVAERLCAAPGSKAYGRLSVVAQTAARPQIVLEAPARAFTPPPKVASAVVRLEPRAPSCDLADLGAVTAAAFGQRRKMLRTSLRPLFGDRLEAALAAVGATPQSRAETLTCETFAQLAALLAAERADGGRS